MTAPKDRFYARVEFRDFIRHFRKLNDVAIVADIHQSMDDIDDLNDDGTSFGSLMVKWSLARKDKYPKAVENGRKGGRPRKQQLSTPVPASASGDAAVGGLLTPWERPETGETLERADAGIRKDPDASATVRAQTLDGDAATREGAEDNSTPQGGCSGLAPSPSNFQKRPGKSATTSYERPIRNGGSERGADGSGAVRTSPRGEKAEQKLRYGSAGNVLLTATEMGRLVSEFGNVGQLVEEMSDYLLLHPNKYRSHYAALRNWCRRRRQEGRNPDGTRMTQGDRLARHFAEREREILDGNVERE